METEDWEIIPRDPKAATYADVLDALKKGPVQLKEVLSRYHGEAGNDVQGLADLCVRESKVSSELKIILMARLLSLSQQKEYLEILNDDFKPSDIKEVLEGFLEQLAKKFDFTNYLALVTNAKNNTTCEKLNDALKEFPTIYKTSINQAEYFVADLCLKKCKIPSELKVLLMTKLLSRSQSEYYLEVLNSHFNRDDIKNVLQQLDATTIKKLDEVVKKDEKYKKIGGALKAFQKEENAASKDAKENHAFSGPRK